MLQVVRIFFCFIVFMLLPLAQVQAKGFDKEWNEIDRLMDSSLINSATNKLSDLKEMIKTNGDDQEKLRVEVYQLALGLKYSYRLPDDLQKQNKQYYRAENEVVENAYKRMYEIYPSFNDEVVKVIASLYMADMLACYSERVGKNRTKIVGRRLDGDISQWSRDELAEKAIEYVKGAAEHLDVLVKFPIEDYYPLIKKTYDEYDYSPSVADYVVDMAAVIFDGLDYQGLLSENEVCVIYTDLKNPSKIDIVDWSRRLARLHAERGEFDAVIATELQRMDWIDERSSLIDLKLKWLEQLLSMYKGTKGEALLTAKIISLDASVYNYSSDCLDKGLTLAKTLDTAVKSFQSGRAGRFIRNVYAYEKEPMLRAYMKKHIFSKDEDLTINMIYANVDKVNVKLYRMHDDSLVSELDRQFGNNLYPISEMGYEEIDFPQSEYSLCPSVLRNLEDDVIELPSTLKYGNYLAVVDYPGQNTYKPQPKTKKDSIAAIKNKEMHFMVSDLDIIETEVTEQGMYLCFVVNRKTGYPVKGAEVDVYRFVSKNPVLKVEPVSKTYTAADGSAKLNLTQSFDGEDYYSSSYLVTTRKGEDMMYMVIKPSRQYSRSNRMVSDIALFSDRSVYRPSQQINFKGVVYGISPIKDTVHAESQVSVELKNANGQVVKNLNLTTNKFGSFSGSFDLPADAKLGKYRIYAKTTNSHFENQGSDILYVNVEEYKRPTMEVVFDPIGIEVECQRDVKIGGKVQTLTEMPLAGCKVKIVGSYIDTTITTDKNGHFTAFLKKMMYNSDVRCRVKVFATSPYGETREAELLFIRSWRDTVEILKVKPSIEKSEKIKVFLEAESRNNFPLNVTTRLIVEKRNNAKVQEVYNKEVCINHKCTVEIPCEDWMPGSYVVRLVSSSDDYKTFSRFFIFDKDDLKKGVDDAGTLFYSGDEVVTLEPGKQVDVYLGSKFDDVQMQLMWLKYPNDVRKREWMSVDKELKKVTLRYEDFFDDVRRFEESNFCIFFEHDAVLYTKSIRVKKALAPKILNVKLESFRDKVKPGSKEEWKLTVKPNTNDAEVMCVMYDASLDAYKNHQWNLFYEYYTNSVNAWIGSGDKLIYTKPHVRMFSYLHLERFQSLPIPSLWSSMFRQYHCKLDRPDNRNFFFSAEDAKEEEEEVAHYGPPHKNTEPKTEKETLEGDELLQKTGNLTVRENLSEVAFFLPHLTSNQNGEVSFSFTMPEGLTRWKLMALAHTCNLDMGSYTTFVESYMPFCIQPGLPRFVRAGDKQHFSALVLNREDGQRDVKVLLNVVDVLSGKVIHTDEKNVRLIDKQAAVDFSYNVPSHVSAIKVQMSAISGEYSDGEVHQLLVLPSGTRVQKSVDVVARKGENKTVCLPALENGATNQTLTLEYSGNAAWNVLMALPAVAQWDDNSIDLSVALYIRALSADLALKYPEIGTLVNEWKKSGLGDRTGSPLAQNAELKDALMDETPWLMEAEREAEWRSNVAAAIDKERALYDCKVIVDKLMQLKNEDGGFGWKKGMPSNLYASITVAEQMERILNFSCSNMYGLNWQTDYLLQYLDEVVQKDYDLNRNLQKDSTKAWQRNVEAWHLQVMLLRLKTNRKYQIPENVKKIYGEYMAYAKHNWKDLSLYCKAMLALTLEASGDHETAKMLVNVLRETLNKDKNGALYWNHSDSYGWYDSDIRVHALAMQAFATIDKKEAELDGLALWLMLKKRTNMWESKVASADAVYALLNTTECGHSMQSATETGLVCGGDSIIIGGKGENYVKRHFSTIESTPDKMKVEVLQSDDVPGYGALYVSYDCPYNLVNSAGNGISVKKEIYKFNVSKNVNVPIKQGEALKVGDQLKVVLTVKCDQTYDFVFLKDLRMACCEPSISLSGYYSADNVYCYRSYTDCSVRFFFDRLQKGTYVFEYPLTVTNLGEYSAGIATIQCLYAPSFQGNSGNGGRLIVR